MSGVLVVRNSLGRSVFNNKQINLIADLRVSLQQISTSLSLYRAIAER